MIFSCPSLNPLFKYTAERWGFVFLKRGWGGWQPGPKISLRRPCHNLPLFPLLGCLCALFLPRAFLTLPLICSLLLALVCCQPFCVHPFPLGRLSPPLCFQRAAVCSLVSGSILSSSFRSARLPASCFFPRTRDFIHLCSLLLSVYLCLPQYFVLCQILVVSHACRVGSYSGSVIWCVIPCGFPAVRLMWLVILCSVFAVL